MWKWLGKPQNYNPILAITGVLTVLFLFLGYQQVHQININLDKVQQLEVEGNSSFGGPATFRKSLVIGTSTISSGTVLEVYGSGSSTVEIGDPSRGKPACLMLWDYPIAKTLTYFWSENGKMIASTTPCH